MSKTKRYRAATLRDALQQIKEEMGEDALVLGHKKIHSGGFMGVGGRDLVEVHVAADSPRPARKAAETRPEKTWPEKNWHEKTWDDERPINPQSRELRNEQPQLEEKRQVEQPTAPLIAGFAKRAYAEISATEGLTLQTNASAKPTPSVVVPRIPGNSNGILDGIQRVPAAAPQTLPSGALNGNAQDSTQQRPASVASELSRVRSELREMKLSLSLLSRPSTQMLRPREIDGEFEGNPAIFDSPNYETYLEMMETGLDADLVRRVMTSVVSDTTNRTTTVAALTDALDSTLKFASDYLALTPGSPDSPAGAVFVGPTGVGKTTTIAKLAAQAALSAKRRVELITLDTYRIAAAEQLKRYAEVIGAGCHIARSVAELDELVRRLGSTAKVFVDTAGRSPNDLADQLELADYLRRSTGLLKFLVLQATTHPADALIAVRKFELFGLDQLIITKLDETVRPGAAVGITEEARLPLTYICAGQRIPEDIQRANPSTLASRVLSATLRAAAAAA